MVHLAVENNDFFIAELGKIGVEMISVHHESALHCDPHTFTDPRDGCLSRYRFESVYAANCVGVHNASVGLSRRDDCKIRVRWPEAYRIGSS